MAGWEIPTEIIRARKKQVLPLMTLIKLIHTDLGWGTTGAKTLSDK
jgi:hypothetical protein